MSTKSLVTDSHEVARAVRLIELGARMAVLESETSLSHERLLRLHREVTGESPSKGQLPYSTDWFVSWQPNIHSSLFLNVYMNLDKACAIEQIDLISTAWQLYAADVRSMGVEPMLSITRAWRLVKFVDNNMLTLTPCTECGGHFVTHTHDYDSGFKPFVCGLCNPPARAGKSLRNGSIH